MSDELIHKALAGLMTAQTTQADFSAKMSDRMDAMATEMNAVAAGMTKLAVGMTSLSQETREGFDALNSQMAEVCDVLRRIGDNSADLAKRVTAIESRLDRLEEAS